MRSKTFHALYMYVSKRNILCCKLPKINFFLFAYIRTVYVLPLHRRSQEKLCYLENFLGEWYWYKYFRKTPQPHWITLCEPKRYRDTDNRYTRVKSNVCHQHEIFNREFLNKQKIGIFWTLAKNSEWIQKKNISKSK